MCHQTECPECDEPCEILHGTGMNQTAQAFAKMHEEQQRVAREQDWKYGTPPGEEHLKVCKKINETAKRVEDAYWKAQPKFVGGQCPSCLHGQHVGGECVALTDSGIICLCPAEAAIKQTKSKVRGFGLFAWDALEEIVEVCNYGIRKGYQADSWRDVKVVEYEDALVRHWIAMKTGQAVDTESGLRHVAHLAWNAIAILILSRK